MTCPRIPGKILEANFAIGSMKPTCVITNYVMETGEVRIPGQSSTNCSCYVPGIPEVED